LKYEREICLTKQSPNTAYTAHFVRPNFVQGGISYMLETLAAIDRQKRKEAIK